MDKALRRASVVCATSVLIAGCGASRSGTDSAKLPAARAFRGYTLYWLGRSYQGLPLTSVEPPYRPNGSWSFGYGTCNPSANEGGCALPLEVQNWSICSRFPALYGVVRRVRGGRVHVFHRPTPRTSPARGAQTLPAGGGLDVYTGRTAVAIFGRRDPRQVLRSLRPLSGGHKARVLPAPTTASLAGKLGCQDQAMGRKRPTGPPGGAQASSQHPVTSINIARGAGAGLTEHEAAEARRIVARDPLLRPLLGAAGGYSLAPHQLGMVTTNNLHQLVGATMKLTFNRHVSGDFRLPVICNDLRGRFIPLQPLRFELNGVSWIRVEVSFTTRRVLSVDETNGHERTARGVHSVEMPRGCRRENRRSRGE